MSTVLDVWNQALSEAGAQAMVSDQNEDSKEARTCRIHYDNLRTSVLRAAHWSCARFQTSLTKVESYEDDPATNQPPWLFGYTYPTDCLKVRYLISPPLDENGDPLTTGAWNFVPCRNNRFLPALSTAGTAKVILTSVDNAIAVYTKDVTDVNLWDQGLWDAITSALTAKLAIPISGNVQMKTSFEQLAVQAVNNARAQDGNEAMPTSDHMPDWIKVRGVGQGPWPYSGVPFDNMGIWYAGWDSLSWGE